MKHWLITQWRIIKAGGQNFVRNATLAVAAMAVMIITLTIVLFSVIINATFANTIQQITNKIDISVYLKDSVTPPQRNQLISDLQHLPNVQSVQYISKDEALTLYKAANQNNQE